MGDMRVSKTVPKRRYRRGLQCFGEHEPEATETAASTLASRINDLQIYVAR